jgi:DNA replicative helicase MCM subunit Mcm2 (Cdc46/Mcm family)
MSQVERQELEKFRSFYRRYCDDDIARLAQRYPNEQRSLHLSYNDLYTFDADLAERYLNKPEDMQEIAEEALRTYDLPADVSLGQAHVRLRGLPSSSTIDIRNIRVVDDHIGSMVAVKGIVRKATDVRPKIVEAAFECQRCGTMTYIPQSDSGFQEPHECQGCERQGPFRINHDQSEFIDAQTLRIQESPEGLRGGETPQSIDVYLEDDICGAVTPGDHVSVAGVLHIEQQTSGNEKTALFDLYMDGVTVTIEDEEFEDMDIDDEDVTEILELADSPDIYERMVDSVAPSIYGYREEKLAMILQLFSGVTKHLPDESRIRGDLHMLLIGDPGTGKCVRGDTPVTLADGSEEPIRELVESNLDDPDPVDDGVYDDADFTVPSLSADGNLVERQATRVWKREAPEELVRIETASGREIEVTPSHPLFVSAGGGFEARRASELDEGSFVATPRTVPSGGGNEIEATYRESESPNAVRLNLPDEWTPQLARLVGYIVAEGYVSLNDDNTGSIFLTNNDQEVLDDAGDALESLGLNYTVRDPHEGKDAREIICTGGEFISFLKNLEPALLKGSSEQQVPEPIFTASDGIRRAFLRAYIEGEGHVSTTQRSVTVASTSRKLLEDVRSLLLSFGIGTSLEERNNGSYRLRISGENFRRFRGEVGLITERKREALTQFDSVETNTNTDVVPNVGEELERIRTRIGLSQFDCGVARTTYQHYERGDRQPSRESLVKILDTFEERLDWLRRSRDRLAGDDWDVFEVIRNELNVSQSELASATSVSQGAISGYERGDVVPDGGVTTEASQRLVEEIDSALGVETAVKSLRHLVEGDVRWDKIATIERIDHDEDWVYDLEVEGTHSYVSNGIVSHNSQLLSYVRNIAPRSVYTSGKGSSSAGLCVTGDTLVHTTEGIRRVEDLVTPEIPEAVDTETAAEREYGVYTYDQDAEETRVASTSHVWRMPERQCRRIETAAGKEVEASTNTPVLTCGEEGPEWTEISEVEAGDYVATPKFDGLDRSSPEVGSVVDADLRWDEVVAAVDTGEKEVYDLTVPETNNFVADGVVTHNTAAAVQDDFGDGQQWTLEAGALVLADKGIAAVDELDKMAADDRSAMHEALEQQSYHPDSEVLLADGRRVEIGDFVDEKMAENREKVADGIDCEIRPVEDVRVHSVDLDSNEVTKEPVDRVSRHEAPDEFVRVEFSNGREVTVTPEHPMFVDRDGIETTPATTIEPGDFVPAPRALPNSAEPVELDGTEQIGKEKDVTLPDELSPELAEILGFLIAEGHSYAGSSHEIGFSNQDERLLDRMDRLFGEVFGMESTDTTNAAGTVTKRWISTKLYRWFESNFPEFMHTARDKRMPASVLGASTEEIRRFLVGAFAGDGSVESEAMAFSTASPGLAEDYADALSKLGIASRLNHDPAEDSWKTYVMGDSTERFVEKIVEPADSRHDDAVAFAERSEATPRHHDVLPTSVVEEIRSIKRQLGVSLSGEYTSHIEEEYGIQVETVEAEIETLRERVETIRSELSTTESVADLRATLGWSGRQLAERIEGETTSSIHYAEDGGYDERRRESIRDRGESAARAVLTEAERRIDQLEDRCELRYYRVTDVETVSNDGDDACEWVYDVTVEPTNTFVSDGVVLHNSVSISKAGINATLKSRCSLLGAANPKYGRFDQYEPIGEQIDLEPALISRFDLIFTVTDQPDPDHDARLAEHILTTNYAGELNTQKTQMTNSEITQDEVDSVQEEVAPDVDADLLRKYVAYSKRNCYPRMSDEAREAIQEFYVDLRAKGADEDAPVPVTARKLEALVRLAEASARVRLSDEVSEEDAERVIEIVRSCLQDIGVDPETGEFDADVVETGQSKTQRDRVKNLKQLLRDIDDEFENEPGAPRDRVYERADEIGIDHSRVEDEIEKLKTRGDIYFPDKDHIKVV